MLSVMQNIALNEDFDKLIICIMTYVCKNNGRNQVSLFRQGYKHVCCVVTKLAILTWVHRDWLFGNQSQEARGCF